MDWLQSRIFKVISTIVLSLFIWDFCLFQVAYAIKSDQRSALSGQQTSASVASGDSPRRADQPRAGGKLQKTIDDIGEIIEEVEKLGRLEDKKTEKEKLKAKKQDIEALDVEIKRQFAETEEKIKDLSEEIKQRHRDFVGKYQENLKELRTNLEAVEKAKTEVEEDREVEKLRKYLKKVKPPKKHISLDPNKLPHRTPEVKEIKLQERKPGKKFKLPTPLSPPLVRGELKGGHHRGAGIMNRESILVASNGSLAGLLNSPQDENYLLIAQADTSTSSVHAPPMDSDLAETIEVQFTPAIIAKAEELENKPVKIYNWVRNNIEFVPTYGSIQGADMCLQTKQCNAFDTASLLIALLRASNIPARYVYGTIELPIEKVMNWVGGVTDPNTAAQILATNGVPGILITEGGTIKYAQFDHMWVEAYVPYGNYRGTMLDDSIKTWIPLDGSFKQYKFTIGLDIAKNVVFNKSSYLSKLNDITPVEFYLQQIQTYLDLNFPGKTIEDVKRTKTIKEEHFELLSPTLPYKTIVKLATLSGLTDIYRYKVGIGIPDLFSVGLTYQVSIPEIIGNRVTISYIPSTSADEQLINQYGGFYNVPAYLLRVKPAMKVEGNIVALGDEISVGTEQLLNVSLIYPGSVKIDRVTYDIKAGGYYALGLDPKGMADDLIEQRFEKYKDVLYADYPDQYNDPLLGEILNMTILRYFNNIDESKSKFAEVGYYTYSKDISEGLAGANIDVSYIYGIPYTITPSTYWIDIKREVSILLHIDGDNSRRIEVMNLLGMTSSVLENQTLEQMMSIESISAVKAIQLANEMGIPVHYINQDNFIQEIVVLSVSEDVKTSIKNAVNQGKVITIPETNIQYNLWYGVGWIVEELTTGAGAYMISGYLMGGETTKGVINKNPSCNLLDVVLFDDVYRAIAFIESRWSQFRRDGTTETSGAAYGIMQIERRSWKGKNWPMTTNPIDWATVLNDWTYNVALGQAIYEYDRNEWVIKKDLPGVGITNPTEEQIMLGTLSRYNNWERYYEKGENGVVKRRDNCRGCDYADAVIKIYKDKTWADRKKLRCH